MMRFWKGLALGALALPAAASAAISCSVSSSGLAFGSYSPLGNANTDSTVAVMVVCTSNATGGTVNYSLTLSPGGGGFAPRKMSSGGNALSYNIYTPASYSAVWGDGAAGTNSVGGSLALGANDNKSATHTGNGRIPSGQNTAHVGSYSDTITVTVSY
jgi:spore coat protein U-like protein